MKWDDNKLTKEKRTLLKQGTKVKFKWHGSDNLYVGRIEVDKYGSLYFVNEHCFKNDEITEINEGMRYYNSLDSFYYFNYFEIIH